MNRCYFFDDSGALLLQSDGTLPVYDNPLPPALLARAHCFAEGEYVMRVTSADDAFSSGLVPHALRSTWQLLSDADYRRAGKAWELLYWSEQTQWCSCCAAPMKWHSAISRICLGCGHEVWPQLGIAIIVLVHRGDEVLLVQSRNFRRNFFGLVAGFVETGESLEECVAREVMEETSLTINNICYFGSQPWPYPLGLMVGFHADWVAGDLCYADGELTAGAFFTRDNLPRHADGTLAIPGKESIARRLIDDWLAQSYAGSSKLSKNNDG